MQMGAMWVQQGHNMGTTLLEKWAILAIMNDKMSDKNERFKIKKAAKGLKQAL